MPEDVDAIQIMTIHKAKGLAFKAVIVDAANIKIEILKVNFGKIFNYLVLMI